MIVVNSKSTNTKEQQGNTERKTGDTDKGKDQADDNRSGQSTNRRHRHSSRKHRPSSYDDATLDGLPMYEFEMSDGSTNSESATPPAPVFDSNTHVVNDPVCYSLMDSQYPSFADLCGALPQTRYSLPNLFGHFERWQIAHVLSTILGSSTPTSPNPTCTRSLRLLICPLLFPPCAGRHEPPAVLPCQPFCRTVKNKCAAAFLDLLPCDFLPYTSDICPVDPSPYSSFLSSYGQQMPPNGGVAPSAMGQSSLPSQLAQGALSLASPQQTYQQQMMQQAGMPQQMMHQTGMPQQMMQQAGMPQQMMQHAGMPQQMMQQTGMPQQADASQMFVSSNIPQQGFPSSMMNPFARSMPPQAMAYYQQLNTPQQQQQQQMVDTKTPYLVDFPPLVYGQRPYFPVTRSANENN